MLHAHRRAGAGRRGDSCAFIEVRRGRGEHLRGRGGAGGGGADRIRQDTDSASLNRPRLALTVSLANRAPCFPSIPHMMHDPTSRGRSTALALRSRCGSLLMLIILSSVTAPLAAQDSIPKPAPQNPSPMVEHTRTHGRIAPRELEGIRRAFSGPPGKPAAPFIPAGAIPAGALAPGLH